MQSAFALAKTGFDIYFRAEFWRGDAARSKILPKDLRRMEYDKKMIASCPTYGFWH
jgi:NADPH-dependent 2,4-dienoyl-CoA reductase/sulfur reductase-like enzyme